MPDDTSGVLNRGAKSLATSPVERRQGNDGRALFAPLISSWIEPLRVKAKNAAPTHVVVSIYDLPEHIRSNAQPGDRGVFDVRTGQVWLIADAIPDKETAVRIWLHEQSLHHGLQALIPDDTRRANVLFSVADHYGDEGLADIADTYGLDLSRTNDRLTAAEEKLAQLAECILPDNATLTKEEHRALWEKVLDAVRGWLRERLPVGISEHEIADLIRAAHQTVMVGKGDDISPRIVF